MPIIHINGDIFTSNKTIIGHGVNTEGAMGSGIAKTVRSLFPQVYSQYREVCLNEGLHGGQILPIWALQTQYQPERCIMNIASQEKQGRNANYNFMESAIDKVFQWVNINNFDGFALPKIGSDIGGLEWDNVQAIIMNQSRQYLNLEVELWNYSV